jgi:hypothetical protein
VFTPEGRTWLGEWIAEELMEGAWLVVADGAGESAVATITDARYNEEEGTVEASALFDSDNANFEWAKHAVKLKDGTIIDREVKDMGRKQSGSVWTLKVSIDVKS